MPCSPWVRSPQSSATCTGDPGVIGPKTSSPAGIMVPISLAPTAPPTYKTPATAARDAPSTTFFTILMALASQPLKLSFFALLSVKTLFGNFFPLSARRSVSPVVDQQQVFHGPLIRGFLIVVERGPLKSTAPAGFCRSHSVRFMPTSGPGLPLLAGGGRLREPPPRSSTDHPHQCYFS